MRHFDLSPLHSSTIGFDRIFSLLSDRAADSVPAYPPYNIEKFGPNNYRISIAVAGFDASELNIETRENALTIRGAKRQNEDEQKSEFLFRGIAERTFERRFQLADYVSVGGASLVNGLLHVDLVREVPEAAKPKKIEIATAAPQTISAAPANDKQALAA